MGLTPAFSTPTIMPVPHFPLPHFQSPRAAADRVKLDSFNRRCKRLVYCSQNQPSFTQLLDDADDSFFDRITMNSEHVLQPYCLSDQKSVIAYEKDLIIRLCKPKQPTSTIKTIWYECYIKTLTDRSNPQHFHFSNYTLTLFRRP